MLKRRVLAAALALLMAGVGGVLLLSYIGRADQRAMAGMQTVRVLVVKAAVLQGSAAESLGPQVVLKTLPATAVPAGALSNLKQVSGRVTTADLQPGEQLLSSRFVDPATLGKPGEVTLPDGSLQVSVSFPAPQAVGGHLQAGDKVSIFATKPTSKTKQATLVLDHVLVAKVAGGVAPAAPAEGESDKEESASAGGSVLVTFAVSANQAAQILSQVPNNPWLSLEPAPAKAGLAAAGSTAR